MKKFKRIIVNGLALAIPLAIVGYVFLKIIEGFEKIISPIANKMGIENLLGELTLTFLAIICILILIMVLGILMQLAFISAFSEGLETILLRFFPWLNQLKTMAADTLNLDNVSTSWKAVLLYHEHCYNLAFLVDESELLVSFFVIKGANTDDGEIITIEKDQVTYSPIEASDIRLIAKQYGRGVIALAEKIGK